MTVKKWVLTAMIDDPGQFAPLENWEVYLAQIKTLPENDMMRASEIRYAKRVIARKRKELNERQ